MENIQIILTLLILAVIVITIPLLYIIYKTIKGGSQSNGTDINIALTNMNRTVRSDLENIADRLNRGILDQSNNINSQTSQMQNMISAAMASANKTNLEIISQQLYNIKSETESHFEKIKLEITNNLDNLKNTHEKKLDGIENNIEKRLNENFNQHTQSIQQVTVQLGEINKNAENMIKSTSSIDRLNSIFERTSSKAFGSFAEDYLDNLLSMQLPNLYQKQVSIAGKSDKIDFVIEFAETKIGIDSKFPLTSYEDFTNEDEPSQKSKNKTSFLRNVREIASALSKKYGQEFEHLLMYVPSDNIFTEISSDRTTMDSINHSRICLVSPTTMMTVVYAISALKNKVLINEGAKKMQENISKIEKSLEAFSREYSILGKKLNEAQDKYQIVNKHVSSLSGQVKTVKNIEIEGIKTDTENLADLESIIDESLGLESKLEKTPSYNGMDMF